MSDPQLVHPVPVESAEAWLSNLITSLLGDPHDGNAQLRMAGWRAEWDAQRAWGFLDGDRWVGTLATHPRRLTVPGPGAGTADLAGEALVAVSVNGTRRRRGLLTQMLTAALADARDRGVPVGVLYAAEWPIYGRFGYAPATAEARYTYLPRLAAVPPTGRGSVRQVDAATYAEIAPAVFTAARRSRPGMVDRPNLWWPRRLGLGGLGPPNNSVLIVRDGDGGPDGVLSWRVDRGFDLDGSTGRITVVDLVAASDDAYVDLWAYLGGLDLVGEVDLPGRPVDEPIRFALRDGRALRQNYAGDAVWLCLLDVPVALAARSYACAGTVVLEVVGDAATSGRFVLDSDGATATCVPSSAPADVRLTRQALASAYLGAHTLNSLRISGEVDELTPGALARADAMFSTPQAPWNSTPF